MIKIVFSLPEWKDVFLYWRPLLFFFFWKFENSDWCFRFSFWPWQGGYKLNQKLIQYLWLGQKFRAEQFTLSCKIENCGITYIFWLHEKVSSCYIWEDTLVMPGREIKYLKSYWDILNITLENCLFGTVTQRWKTE